VEWLHFNAKHIDGVVLLEWATASEQNSDYFDVERSKNGTDWENFYKKAAAGFSSTTKSYSVIDKNFYNGISYYRLKQVDFDGKFKYSDIAFVNVSTNKVDINIFPNPTRDILYLEISEFNLINSTKIDCVIFDIYGNEVVRNNISTQKTSINLQPLSKGAYYVQLNTGNYTFMKKIIKM